MHNEKLLRILSALLATSIAACTGMDGSTQLFGSYFYGVIVERWVGDHWMLSAGPGYALEGNSCERAATSRASWSRADGGSKHSPAS
jgi:hypothetical protein